MKKKVSAKEALRRKNQAYGQVKYLGGDGSVLTMEKVKHGYAIRESNLKQDYS